MIWKFSWMLFLILTFSACTGGEDLLVVDSVAEDEDLLVVDSANEDDDLLIVDSTNELKKIKAKKIIWKKDEAEMVLIPYKVVIPEKTVPAVYDEFGDLVSAEIVVPEQINSLPFYMDAYEVTVGQFKKFLKSSGYKPSPAINWNDVYEYSHGFIKLPMEIPVKLLVEVEMQMF